MELKQEMTSQFINIFYLIGRILYEKHKFNIDKILSWMEAMNKCFEKRKYKVLNVEESIFMLLLNTDDILSQRHIIMLVNNCEFDTYHYKWTVIQFTSERVKLKRLFFIVPSSRIPLKTFVITNVALFNLKSALNVNNLSPLKVCFELEKILEDLIPSKASKAVVSFYSAVFQGTLTRIFSNFLKYPRFVFCEDICCINIRLYLDKDEDDYIYFKINKIEGEQCSNEFNIYALTEETTIMDECAQNFFPSKEWELGNYKDINSVTTVLPLGLEKYYCHVLKWCYPFLQHHIQELKPVFVLSGPSGIGKNIMLDAISKRLGVNYKRIDCNNIISNTVTQIKSNVLHAFKEAISCSPIILHFSHAELLSTVSGGNDPVQVVEAFSENIKNITSKDQIIIIFSCFTIELLSSHISNLSLQTLHMDNPDEHERKLMLCWLAHRLSIPINDDVITFAATKSNSFTLADLTKMSYLSNKRRIELRDSDTVEKNHIKWFLDEQKEKGKISEVEWEDIGGVDKLKREVLGSLMSSRLVPGLERRGLLLHGPPGTGKTLLARAVASQCNRNFIPVKGPELLNMYVGQSEANLRQVFAKAREASPSILFFDELDSLAPNRGKKSDSGGVMDRVVSQLLAEMDGLDNNTDVFILAATNRPDLIDPALLRPGRFDKMLYIGPCEDNDSKEKVMKAITRKFILGEDVDITELAGLLPKEITGASMYGICSSAWMEAAREIINDPESPKDSKVVVKKHHFERALLSSKS